MIIKIKGFELTTMHVSMLRLAYVLFQKKIIPSFCTFVSSARIFNENCSICPSIEPLDSFHSFLLQFYRTQSTFLLKPAFQLFRSYESEVTIHFPSNSMGFWVPLKIFLPRAFFSFNGIALWASNMRPHEIREFFTATIFILSVP